MEKVVYGEITVQVGRSERMIGQLYAQLDKNIQGIIQSYCSDQTLPACCQHLRGKRLKKNSLRTGGSDQAAPGEEAQLPSDAEERQQPMMFIGNQFHEIHSHFWEMRKLRLLSLQGSTVSTSLMRSSPCNSTVAYFLIISGLRC